MERPDEVNLSRKDGEVLLARLHRDTLTAQDRQVLAQVLRWYFWLLFALQEARFSLQRLRALVFGEKPRKRTAPPPAPSAAPQASNGEAAAAEMPQAPGDRAAAPAARPGHGRWGAQAYRGATSVECRHKDRAVGERCPVCGRGRLYRLEPGVDVRLDGHALLSAVR